ncbi:DUF5009 domain-containing protein [bacterium]|nr:DUF5009 domain-containing protein [bacterium]
MDVQSKRLISLDVFRGITIMGMILVNNPGSWSHVYPPLEHAAWHGWTPTDFIFPFFLFIVGTAMSFSFSKYLSAGKTLKQLFPKIVRRTLIIFALGVFLNLFPLFQFDTVRIPGVLQRIAICYFATALIILGSDKKWQIFWTVFFLTVYWFLLKIVPVPGFGAGTLDMQGNLCWYIDKHLFAGHTWQAAPVPGFDPEGLFSTLPAISTTLLGVFTGDWLRSNKSDLEKVTGLFVSGTFALLLGSVMSIWLPINKNLWTSSYTVFMTGMALIFLAMCYWLIEIRGCRRWAKPFIIFGSNAILVYVLAGLVGRIIIHVYVQSDITVKEYIYTEIFKSWAGSTPGSLLFAIAYVLFWLGIMYIFYRKKIFIKI